MIAELDCSTHVIPSQDRPEPTPGCGLTETSRRERPRGRHQKCPFSLWVVGRWTRQSISAVPV